MGGRFVDIRSEEVLDLFPTMAYWKERMVGWSIGVRERIPASQRNHCVSLRHGHWAAHFGNTLQWNPVDGLRWTVSV